jgi:hypothetical protein
MLKSPLTRRYAPTSPRKRGEVNPHKLLPKKSRANIPAVLHAIRDWGDRFLRGDPENIVTFRHSCGAELRVEIRGAACGEVVAPGDVTGDRDVRRSDIVCAEAD